MTTLPLSRLVSLLVLAAALLSAAPPATAPAIDGFDGAPVAIVESVHDGDTLRASLNFAWGVTLRNQTIRCADYDAPEISRARRTVGEITDAELERGRVAARDFSLLLAGASRVYAIPVKESRDVYGRILARLVVEDATGKRQAVGDYMRAKGHVR